ncbi:hypothetical protein KR084_009539 [Drosophila pseudotakahashii]|nr:hypothetical protein KR084_009539 [Drosophila pseudotakahashii]
MLFVMKLFMKNKWRISHWMLLGVGVLLLMTQAASSPYNNQRTTTNATCRHATDMWGDPDPNIFYVCSRRSDSESASDDSGGQPLQLECPPGRGFFSGLGYLGCLPYAQWPACRPSEEQMAAELSAGCDSDTRPWASPDPNKFYLCPGPKATPLLLSCSGGKGFVANSEVVGCADWPQWRRQLQCEDYY